MGSSFLDQSRGLFAGDVNDSACEFTSIAIGYANYILRRKLLLHPNDT
jgi:hypothetical protein